MARHVMLVFGNAVEGKDAELNEWYDREHLVDVLKIPGIVTGRRYVLSAAQRRKPPFPYRYLAFYEIETDDLQTVIDELDRRVGAGVLTVDPSFADGRLSWFFDAFGVTESEPLRSLDS